MVEIKDVQEYWEANPLCAAAIPHPLGSREYFDAYDRLREENESLAFSYDLHEYRAFRGKKVLDVGCGNGYVLSKYAIEGAETVGVDLTETGIRLCRERFALLDLPGTFVVGNAESLPFEAETFDCVCSMGVLHHTPDTEKAVEELFRVLKPNGRLIVMFYHRNSALYHLNFRRQRLRTRKTMDRLVNEVDGIGNPKGTVYSRAELKVLLSRFHDLEMFSGLMQGWMVDPKVGYLVPARVLRAFGRRWGWFLYAKGVKPAS